MAQQPTKTIIILQSNSSNGEKTTLTIPSGYKVVKTASSMGPLKPVKVSNPVVKREIPATSSEEDVNLCDDSDYSYFDSHSVYKSQQPARKRQRLDHLSADEKLNRRKLRNRIAAQQARDRKKVLVDNLGSSLSQITAENDRLRRESVKLHAENETLRKENERLRSQITESHTPASSSTPVAFESAALISVPQQQEQVARRRLACLCVFVVSLITSLCASSRKQPQIKNGSMFLSTPPRPQTTCRQQDARRLASAMLRRALLQEKSVFAKVGARLQ